MPKGVYTCQYNGCGKSCMREDGWCYRHSEVGQQNKRKAMKVYKQSDAYKKRVAEREREKREELEAEAERRVEEKRKQIIEEYRKSLKKSGIEDKKLSDPKSSLPLMHQVMGEEKEESDDESHPSSCSTCSSDEEGKENDVDQQVDEMHKKMDQLQVDDKIDVSDNLDSVEELEEEDEN